jgi:cell shape-determining protein MreC
MQHNSTWVITVLHIVGVLCFIIGAFTFLKSGSGILVSVISVLAAAPFFFFAQVLQNMQKQTELLEEIKKNTSGNSSIPYQEVE